MRARYWTTHRWSGTAGGGDTHIAMGNLDGRSTHVHLYLNGLYWGIYNPFERPDAEYAVEYLGGREQDWDSVLSDATEVVDGDAQGYNAMYDLIRTGPNTPEEMAEIERHADLNSLIDLLLVNAYMAHDEHELQALGSRVGDPNFQFFAHDLDEKRHGVPRSVSDNQRQRKYQNGPRRLHACGRTSGDAEQPGDEFCVSPIVPRNICSMGAR